MSKTPFRRPFTTKQDPVILHKNGRVGPVEAPGFLKYEAELARENAETLSRANTAGDHGVTRPATPKASPIAPVDNQQVGHLYVEAKHYFGENRLDLAVQLLNQAVELDVTFSKGWQLLADTYKELEAYELALNAIQAVLALEPFNFKALKTGAILSEKLEAWELASTYFKRYIRRFPNDVDATFGAAVALEYRGEFHQAIELYDVLLIKNPHYLPALNNQAGCFMQLNMYEDAISRFSNVLEQVPDFPRAILGLAIAQDLYGLEANAVLNYRRYLHFRPDSEHAESIRERLQQL